MDQTTEPVKHTNYLAVYYRWLHFWWLPGVLATQATPTGRTWDSIATTWTAETATWSGA